MNSTARVMRVFYGVFLVNTFLLNNCRRVVVISDFKIDNAFYCFHEGTKAHKDAISMRRGDECIVALYTENKKVCVSSYIFEFVAKIYDKRLKCYAFILSGECVGRRVMSKADAAKTVVIEEFFDRKGNFKPRSIIQY